MCFHKVAILRGLSALPHWFISKQKSSRGLVWGLPSAWVLPSNRLPDLLIWVGQVFSWETGNSWLSVWVMLHSQLTGSVMHGRQYLASKFCIVRDRRLIIIKRLWLAVLFLLHIRHSQQAN